MIEPIETAPTMDLTPPDIDRLVAELRASQAIYSPLLQRREQREGAEKSLHGLLLEMPRKAIEPMVLALEGATGNAVRTLPCFISAGPWEDEALLRRHGQAVDRELGEDDGVLPLDGSDLLQQGQESVGGTRPYCGEVGKRAHGQAGVFVGSASRTGSTLLDRRRSLPQEGVEDETSAERRRRGGVPADIAFKTKPMVGWEMIHAVPHASTWRGRGVTCEEALGRDTAFLAQVAGLGWWYCAEGPHDTQVWRPRPATAVPRWVGRGRKPTRVRVVEGALAAQTVAAVAAEVPAEPWSRQPLQEGRKGPPDGGLRRRARHRYARGLARP